MQRREFISFLGSAVASWPLAARAQQTRTTVIGLLGIGLAPRPNSPFVAALSQGLAEAGYLPGQNVAFEFARADSPLSLPRLAAELVNRKVDVIVTVGSPYAAVAAKEATSTIPIVFLLSDDPMQYGLVTSLGRPGGNVTGFSFLSTELIGKSLNLLLESVPQATKIGFLSIPQDSTLSQEMEREVFAAGRALGREIIVLSVRNRDFEAAFTTVVEQGVSALIVANFTAFRINRAKIVELAARHRIAAMYPHRDYVVSGGLMSYGATGISARELARDYVGQILKGAKPADLPVRQPTKFDLSINLKTAKALGLTIPRTLFATATELIE
jgi:putative ABC transport system substrate-binding protein